MLAELALTVAMATTGAGMVTGTRTELRESALMSRAARSSFALGDYGLTEGLIRWGGREEINPLGQKASFRAALTMARVAALTKGLEAMEQAGAPRRVVKGAEWGLVGHSLACVAINAAGALGHDLERPGTALLLSSVASAAVGAILNR